MNPQAEWQGGETLSVAPTSRIALSPADRAVAYVQQHYRHPAISLAEVARAAGISRFHLARLLRRLTRRSFLEHVHALRIGDACRLLAASALSVKEIAASVGYNDATQFCRQFRRAQNMSPGSYRRLARARIADEEQSLPTLDA
jgi:AraC-like DNA-binding protein